MLEDNYVAVIRMFFNFGKTQSDIADSSSYDSTTWSIINTFFGTKEVWEYILKTYPRYINMIYNYLSLK